MTRHPKFVAAFRLRQDVFACERGLAAPKVPGGHFFAQLAIDICNLFLKSKFVAAFRFRGGVSARDSWLAAPLVSGGHLFVHFGVDF